MGDRRLRFYPGLVSSPGEGNGYPLQCSWLDNPMDRGAWRAVVHGVAKSRTWLSTQHRAYLAWERVGERIGRERLRALRGKQLPPPKCGSQPRQWPTTLVPCQKRSFEPSWVIGWEGRGMDGFLRWLSQYCIAQFFLPLSSYSHLVFSQSLTLTRVFVLSLGGLDKLSTPIPSYHPNISPCFYFFKPVTTLRYCVHLFFNLTCEHL